MQFYDVYIRHAAERCRARRESIASHTIAIIYTATVRKDPTWAISQYRGAMSEPHSPPQLELHLPRNSMLQVTNRSSVLADGKHDEQMPDAVRAATDAVQALRPLRA